MRKTPLNYDEILHESFLFDVNLEFSLFCDNLGINLGKIQQCLFSDVGFLTFYVTIFSFCRHEITPFLNALVEKIMMYSDFLRLFSIFEKFFNVVWFLQKKVKKCTFQNFELIFLKL